MIESLIELITLLSFLLELLKWLDGRRKPKAQQKIIVVIIHTRDEDDEQ